MNILCRIFGHRPEARTVRNEGRHFSRCRRCRLDLVEHNGRWSTAPRGYRIIWKDAELLLDTPSEAAAEPAARPRRASTQAGKAKAAAGKRKPRNKAKARPPSN
jgi:hypothetical protein